MSATELTNYSFARPHLSFIEFRGDTYYSLYTRARFEPHSSLTQLIQGIWEREPEIARLILRGRIQTTEEIAPMNWGMLRTGARRCSRTEFREPGENWIRVSFENTYRVPTFAESTWLREAQPDWLRSLSPMSLALELARYSHRETKAYLCDRAIGCVLVGALEYQDGRGSDEHAPEILAVAHNTNRSNRCLHAEVNLLQSWWKTHGTHPPRGTLHSTLEPCRMCYGMLEECAPETEIRYLVPDGPGRPLRRSNPVRADGPYERRS
ncbi:MAG: Bd3614 family nucleic acid deaminase [Bdellovibrionia bacterium]